MAEGSTVAVFGGSGYTGRVLAVELRRRGHRVVVVSRRAAPEGSYAGLDAEVMGDDRLSQLRGGRVTIVNLAYPRGVPGLEAVGANRRLLERVTRAVDATGASRLLHASTQGVFGFAWERPPRPGPAPRVPGDAYIETKRDAERALVRHWKSRGRSYDLAVVRLGNILGAGALPWVVGVAQRLMEGSPAASRGGEGRLNGTYVRNIADYFAALVERDDVTADPGGVYHHLAEFADRSWAELIEPAARRIGVPAFYRADAPAPSVRGARAWLGATVRRLGPALSARPRLVSLLHRIRPAPPVRTRGEAIDASSWHVVTSEEHALPASLVRGWRPPHDFGALLAEVGAWIDGHGYPLRV